ncbi:response regulator [Pontibacter pamirensis]|uniref:response regulator n=1 Tax=Pontibacter pamirensis TaxID=2562824 RepID=UPI001389CC6B|nr:response regulator [Pontibacter pamirensis]
MYIAPLVRQQHFPDDMEPIKRILIIDDDTTSIFLARRLLSSIDSGMQVNSAQNGRDALAILKEAKEKAAPPQLILLDINMPVMDGFAFLEEVGQHGHVNLIDTRIVLLTGSQNPVEIALGRNQLAATFLQKPLTKDKLRSIIY